MRVITLSKVKELLGITDSTYDTELTAAITIVDAAVKRITRNRYNYQIVGDVKNGSNYVEVYSLLFDGRRVWDYEGKRYIDDLSEYLEIGQQVQGEGIPDNTIISDVYYNGGMVDFSGDNRNVPVIELSNAATSNNVSAQIFLGINTALQPIIAKAVWWQTEQMNTTINDTTWKSRSMGPVSVTKGEDAQMDGKSGMPLFLLRALPRYHGGH